MIKISKTPIQTSDNFAIVGQFLVLAFLSLAMVIWASASVAQEESQPLPKSGDYKATANSTGYYLVTGLGEGIKSSVFRWSITLQNVAGEGFLHNITGECFALVVFESGMSNQTGWCRYTDADGDLFYEQFQHDGILGEGGGKAIGGTGKYEGITATHHYAFDPLADEDEIESVAIRSGSFSFD